MSDYEQPTNTDTDDYQSDVSYELAQIKVMAQELDAGAALPVSPEEQAAFDEQERRDSINASAVGLADAEYTQAVGLGVNAIWSLAFPNWTLEEAELQPMANLTRMVIDKHCPDVMEKAGPEVMLGMVALTAITSRVSAGIPPRGPLPGEGGDDE